MGRLHQDDSYQARSESLVDFLPVLIGKPAGLGLGTVGLGSKVESGGQLTGGYVNFDNGYFAILITFGLIGGALVFRSLWLLGSAAASVRSTERRPYAFFALAILCSTLFGLASVDILSGLGGVLLWFVLGIGMCPAPPANETAATQ